MIKKKGHNKFLNKVSVKLAYITFPADLDVKKAAFRFKLAFVFASVVTLAFCFFVPWPEQKTWWPDLDTAHGLFGLVKFACCGPVYVIAAFSFCIFLNRMDRLKLRMREVKSDED